MGKATSGEAVVDRIHARLCDRYGSPYFASEYLGGSDLVYRGQALVYNKAVKVFGKGFGENSNLLTRSSSDPRITVRAVGEALGVLCIIIESICGLCLLYRDVSC